MIFDAKIFLKSYQIKSRESGEDWQKGWVQIQCPFCGDPKQHGGFKLATGHYNCWRCGYHSTVDIVSKLLRIPLNETFKLIKHFLIFEKGEVVKEFKHPEKLQLPAFTNRCTKIHFDYLKLVAK